LLRTLEAEGLVRVRPSADDQRVRVVGLTAAGRAERAELDRLSDDLAGSLLESLDEPHRDQLVAAMTTVERLLTVGLVEVIDEDPTSVDAQHCLDAYFRELDERFEGGFDVGRSIPADATDLVEPAGLLLVARLDGRPVGAGAVKFHGADPAEIKRMWVAGQARGLGVGRRILTDLERRARDHGASTARLETNRALTEAIALYRSTGYVEVARFNDEPYAHHWFEKDLRA
jgi:ribosomal protein S18 acetylase RimI-like enzyme